MPQLVRQQQQQQHGYVYFLQLIMTMYSNQDNGEEDDDPIKQNSKQSKKSLAEADIPYKAMQSKGGKLPSE